MSSDQIEKLIRKIVVAREIGERIIFNSKDPALHDFRMRLREISDKTDLARNDVVVKKAKLRNAAKKMQELERQLDELLSELGKFQCTELDKNLDNNIK